MLEEAATSEDQQTPTFLSDGVVKDGVVIPDKPSALANGARVRIASVGRTEEVRPRTSEWLIALAREAESQPCTLPEDLAANHDHYRLGTPKRS